ncbi:hypothetical protein GCM10009847_27290 [Leucobacter tardus]|uniref:DUF3040 domain-containing protein n=1 Tax=Leucobacter tardus TaxID=501483 RepID=A0A939QGL9_9MICO|nr:DUF3040 domain-containing protein [Leucobacter tardus]MBO2989768.1 DUF3040 domain-containing protein [Leucobacter tardus]
MALSENEQRLLEEMERSFYQSESDVVQTSTVTRGSISYRFLVIGIVVVLAGLGVLVAAVATQLPWLGVIGFGVMLAGVVLMFRRDSSPAAPEEVRRSRPQPSGGSPTAKESMNDRMQRRWDQRMGGER